jgi:DNA-binding response OmpR family regulator
MTDEKIKILLCEDDENLGMILREYLQSKGYDVDLLPDGEAGYKAFTHKKYDLCILDVMMPKKDGFTLAADIRALNSEVPIVLSDCQVDERRYFAGFQTGGRRLFVETFQHGRLLYRIESIMRRIRGEKAREVTVYQIGNLHF